MYWSVWNWVFSNMMSIYLFIFFCMKPSSLIRTLCWRCYFCRNTNVFLWFLYHNSGYKVCRFMSWCSIRLHRLICPFFENKHHAVCTTIALKYKLKSEMEIFLTGILFFRSLSILSFLYFHFKTNIFL